MSRVNVTVDLERFQPVPREALAGQETPRPSTTYWQDAWRRLRQHRLAMLGLTVIVVLVLLAIFVPMLSPYAYDEQNLTKAYQPPSAEHWFGTDNLGRDLFVRTMFGARISLAVGFFSSLMAGIIGILYGAISGYFGGTVDNIMMRIVDIIYGLPTTLYVILLMVVLKPGLKTIFIALAITSWIGMARIVRGQVLSLKEWEFVLAARTLGVPPWKIIWRHLVPNALGPIIVTMTVEVPAAIFTESWLSFLGLGVSAPIASWGSLAADAYQNLRTAPWTLIFPGLFISITMLAFQFLGDGLRDALDPRMRK
nr:MAG: diguanylate cyclase [Bacillota bacterium]